MKRFIVCGAAILALSACKSGWSSAEKDNFLKTCTGAATGSMGAEKAKDYCDCMFPKLEKKYPSAAEADKLNSSDPAVMEMAKECIK